MIRVAHVITGLDRGGAETILYRLLAATGEEMDPVVISLMSDGAIGQQISELGVPVEYLHVHSFAGFAAAVPRIQRRLTRLRPQVLQTWMYHADLLGGLAGKAARVPAVVWGIHATVRSKQASGLLYRSGLATAARLSRVVPDRIVSCSHQAARAHVQIGYAPDRMSVIVNGFESYKADHSKRSELRARLGLRNGALLVGSVSRYHPDKDPLTFLSAASRIRLGGTDAHFLLVGHGLDGSNRELVAAVERLGLEPHVSLLGPTDKVFDIYSALDLVVCSSVAEALPLALGEAMATGVPVVTTDVGDAASLVADPSRVVPPRMGDALGDAISQILALDDNARNALGQRDREHVLSTYGMKQMVDGYFALYRTLIDGR